MFIETYNRRCNQCFLRGKFDYFSKFPNNFQKYDWGIFMALCDDWVVKVFLADF